MRTSVPRSNVSDILDASGVEQIKDILGQVLVMVQIATAAAGIALVLSFLSLVFTVFG